MIAHQRAESVMPLVDIQLSTVEARGGRASAGWRYQRRSSLIDKFSHPSLDPLFPLTPNGETVSSGQRKGHVSHSGSGPEDRANLIAFRVSETKSYRDNSILGTKDFSFHRSQAMVNS